MLNKLQTIKVYQNTKALIEEVIGEPVKLHMTAGSALVLYDLRLLCSDVDTVVDTKTMGKLLSFYKEHQPANWQVKKSENRDMITINHVDIIGEDIDECDVEVREVCGVSVSGYTIEALIKFKERLLTFPDRSQAKKDQDNKDIATLKAFDCFHWLSKIA